MNRINLQSNTKPLESTIEYYWFENEHIGLEKTQFHRITIPLAPFDTGLDYVDQPEKPQIVIDWINLNLSNPAHLDGIQISSTDTEDIEASVYIGSAHNWINIENLTLRKIGPDKYELNGTLEVVFENEGVGENETFRVKSNASYMGEA
jgi:hypothetical protein